MMRPPDLRLSFVLGVAGASLAPFVGKAFHVDDPSFLWAARRLSERPWDPWGYVSVWAGSALPAHVHVNHPPGNAYLVWLGTLIGGESEIALHAWYMLIALLAVAAVYGVARELTARPGLATLAVVASPAFLVTATNLMADVPFLATWTATIGFWLHAERRLASGDAQERQRAMRAFAAAALAAIVCGCIRYNGIALVPLLAAHGIACRRRVGSELVWLAGPLAAFVLYQLAFIAQYGHVSLLTASAFASHVKESTGATPSHLAAVALVFLGGALAPLAALAPFAWSGRALASTLGLAAALAAAAASPLGPYLGLPAVLARPSALVAQAALFAAFGVLALALALDDLRRRRTADSLLLTLWVLGIFAFGSVLNWTVNVRSLLPAAPALAILLARRLDANDPQAVGDVERPLWGRAPGEPPLPPFLVAAPRRCAAALAGALALALATAYVDLAFANRARDGARLAVERARRDGRELWFAGHWGWQWYLEREGAHPIDLAGSRIEPGAYFAQPDWERDFSPPPQLFADVTTVDLGRPPGLATISHSLLANFYASTGYGPLPYAFGDASPGIVRLLEAKGRVDIGKPR